MTTRDFVRFLESRGLILRPDPQSHQSPSTLLVYANRRLVIQVEDDRGSENVYVADPARPEWAYDIDLVIRLWDAGTVNSQPLSAQFGMVLRNWDRIQSLFSDHDRDQTHARLHAIANERAASLAPVWPTVVLEFARFLEAAGLTCEERTTRGGIVGSLVMRYANREIAVQMSSENRWVPHVADVDTTPKEWFAFPLLFRLLEGPRVEAPRFPNSYSFLINNWPRIAELFSMPIRIATLRRMRSLSTSD